jgi:signal transduction histidine kinase
MSRALHDRVLQTLEFVSREDWIADPRMRNHVAADATWLRELVQGELDGRPTHFAAALRDVMARQTRAGLRVEINLASLGAVSLPDPVADALIGAVTELLTNVRKHAGTGHAVLRATSTEESVTVTVMDKGHGFDPQGPAGGIGLRESVVERLRQVGGRAVITSEPWAGTHVALSVPRPGNT